MAEVFQEQINHPRLVITGIDPILYELSHGIHTRRQHISVYHEEMETDIILTNQMVYEAQ